MANESTFYPYAMGDHVFMPVQEFTTGTDEDCVFCAPVEEPSFFDIGEPLGAGNILAKPALGMLIPGYMLTVAKDHVTSFGQLTSAALSEVDKALTEYETKNTHFGTYFRFEHGSDGIDFCSAGAGACIDHAHQHLIPASDVAEYILSDAHPDKDKLPWKQLETFENVTELRGTPYMYLGYAGMHYVVENPGVPSQWIRRQMVRLHPEIGDWDWALANGAQQALASLVKQFGHGQAVPSGRGIVRGDQIESSSHGDRLRSLK